MSLSYVHMFFWHTIFFKKTKPIKQKNKKTKKNQNSLKTTEQKEKLQQKVCQPIRRWWKKEVMKYVFNACVLCFFQGRENYYTFFYALCLYLIFHVNFVHFYKFRFFTRFSLPKRKSSHHHHHHQLSFSKKIFSFSKKTLTNKTTNSVV
jgi:hypothetical protein